MSENSMKSEEKWVNIIFCTIQNAWQIKWQTKGKLFTHFVIGTVKLNKKGMRNSQVSKFMQ